jgi:hypothetical protein
MNAVGMGEEEGREGGMEGSGDDVVRFHSRWCHEVAWPSALRKERDNKLGRGEKRGSGSRRGLVGGKARAEGENEEHGEVKAKASLPRGLSP